MITRSEKALEITTHIGHNVCYSYQTEGISDRERMLPEPDFPELRCVQAPLLRDQQVIYVKIVCISKQLIDGKFRQILCKEVVDWYLYPAIKNQAVTKEEKTEARDCGVRMNRK